MAKLRRGETRKDDDDDVESVEDVLLGNNNEFVRDEKSDILSDGQQTPLEDYRTVSNENSLMPALRVEKNSDQSNKRSSNMSNLISGKEVPKYKKTQSSIIFTMEPRTSKTIYIYFKAIAINADSLQIDRKNMSQRPSQETITSRILVHEHKNTDAVKTVVFKATVCYDHSSYILASSREMLNSENKSESSLPELLAETGENVVKERPSSPFTLRGSPSLKGFDDRSPIKELSGFPHIESAEHVVPETDHLVLEPTTLDIGKLEVNQSHNYYFKLSNRSDHLLNYEIIVFLVRRFGG